MIVGTAGHIDHGKTSLVRKLTGVDTDRLKEEKARGISIDLGFAYWARPSGEIVGFVDVPGHEALVHNMLAGATGIDFVVLVIAADDGVMPQTREHLAIIDLLGLQRGVVALNKCDLVADDQIAAVSRDVEMALAGTGLQGSAIVPVSAVTGKGLPRLTQHVDAAAATPSQRSKEGLFRLAVDRSFTLQGLGTVVTGTVLSGSVRVDDRVVVSPSGLEARVRSINAQNAPVEAGSAGQRCALVLSGPQISKEAMHRGNVVVDPALHAPTARLDASLRVLRSEPRRSASGFPSRCTMLPPRYQAAWWCCAIRQSIPARPSTFNWCWNSLWPRLSETALSFATRLRVGPSAAAQSLMYAPLSGGGVRPSAWPR